MIGILSNEEIGKFIGTWMPARLIGLANRPATLVALATIPRASIALVLISLVTCVATPIILRRARLT